MEWKKDNTSSEKLKLMEKEYIEAALRMMKKAGVNSVYSSAEEKDEHEEKENTASEEIHNNEAVEIIQTNENTADEEEHMEENNENQEEEYSEKEISEVISDIAAGGAASDESVDNEEESEEQENEHTGQDDREEALKSGYGVYTADEILKGEGLMDAERIIEEIKMKNETMKKLTEEQAKKSQRTCPKCGKTIDGCT